MLDRIGRIRGTTLLTGLVLATMALSPAFAHHKKPHTKKQIKQIASQIADRYTKGEADALFLNEGEGDARYYPRTAADALFLTEGLGDARYYTQAQVDALSLGPYARTEVVTVGGTPTQNGNALRSALAGITDASAANRYLVKLEPGTFDIGTQELVMKEFADIEGSGRMGTIITCACGSPSNTTTGVAATIHGAVNTGLRSLSVVNTGGNAHAHGVDYLGIAGEPVRITDVAVEVSGATSGAAGIEVRDAQPVMTRVDVEVTGNGIDLDLYGIRIANAGSASLLHVNASAEGDVNDTWGLYADDSRVTIEGGEMSASDASQNFAVQGVATSDLMLVGVSALAVGGGDRYFGLDLQDSVALVTGSFIVADGEEADGIRVDSGGPPSLAQVTGSTIAAQASFCCGSAVEVNSGGPITVDGSRIVTDEPIASAGSGEEVRFGGSFLDGDAPSGSGTVTCAGVWDENYTFFATTCPS
ncbi:MAG: hypothetical protein ACRDJP_16755 [Actinomycetota bacterium]